MGIYYDDKSGTVFLLAQMRKSQTSFTSLHLSSEFSSVDIKESGVLGA